MLLTRPFLQVDRDEAEMKDADTPAPTSFKKLKSTKSDISGIGKVGHLLSSCQSQANTCRSSTLTSYIGLFCMGLLR